MGHIQINKLISTDVVITKVSEIKPRVIEAWFSCEACNNPILMKQDNENWELESARIFAKKKKLLEKNESYEKKLAKMARAGFSYDICKKILG